MKKLTLCLALVFVAMACTEARSVNNQATKITEERAVADFTGVSSGGFFHVFISLGDKESLRLEGESDILKEIETKVEKGVLKIQYKSKKHYWDWNSSDRSTVNIYITAKTLTNLILSGSGQMKVDGTIKAPDFKASVSGSGSMTVAAEAVKLQATVSGSGNMKLSGSAQTSELTLSGSGNLSGGDFKTKNAIVTVSGSGNAGLTVEQDLKATLSGSGNIRYSGNPNVSETKSGSGKIAKN